MADQTSTIIIDVNVNQADALARADALVKKIRDLKDANTVLKATNQQNTVAYRENAQAIRQLESETRAYINIARQQDGSLNSIRAQIILLNNQYNALSRSEREATTQGRLLQQQLLALRNEERAASQSAGNFSTNIGNYAQSIQQALGVQTQFGSNLIGLARGFNSLTGALEGGATAMNVFKVALASTGIGVLILALGAVINYMRDVDTVTDTLQVKFAGLKAQANELGRSLIDLDFNGLVDRMNIARVATEALTEAQQTLEDKSLAQSVKSAEAQAKVAELRAQALNRALDPKERQRLLAEGERIDAADLESRKKLSDAAIEQAQISIVLTGRLGKAEYDDLKKRGVEASLDFQNNRVRQGKVTEEQTKNLADALKERTAIQQEYTQRSEKRNNLSERLAMQAAEAERRRADQFEKINEDRIKSELTVSQNLITIRQKDFADINSDIDKRVRMYQRYGADTTNLERERLSRIKALQLQFQTADTATVQANVRGASNTRAGLITDPEQRRQAQLDNQSLFDLQDIDKRIEAVAARIALGERGLTELIQSEVVKRDAIVAKSNQDQIKLTEEKESRLREIQAAGQQAYYEELVYQIEREAELNQARLQQNEILAASYGELASSIAGALGKQTAAGKAAFLVQKGFAIAQILINGEMAKSEIILRYEVLKRQAVIASSLAGPFAAFVAGAAVAALSVAQAAEVGVATAREISGVGAVLASTIAGFATGGMIKGAGNGTSDSILARVSNGEAIINAKSTRMFAPILSDMNVAGGGKAFATGGVAGSYIPTLSGQIDGSNAISQAVVAGVAALRPVVYVEDINYQQRKNAVNVSNANF